MQPLFDGAVYVAAKAGVPIVPVGVGGSERCMPKGSKLIYPYKIHVIVGDPIPAPPVVGGRVDRDALAKVTAELKENLQTLFDAARRSPPASANRGALRGRRWRRCPGRRAAGRSVQRPPSNDRGRDLDRGLQVADVAGRGEVLVLVGDAHLLHAVVGGEAGDHGLDQLLGCRCARRDADGAGRSPGSSSTWLMR